MVGSTLSASFVTVTVTDRALVLDPSSRASIVTSYTLSRPESPGCSKSGGFSSLNENWPLSSMVKCLLSVPPTDHVTSLPSGSVAR